ncbi:MAG: hypothetical protein ABH863_03565 [Candidatus Micrarchaeota archaeon]
MKRGIFFSLDAVLALIIALSLSAATLGAIERLSTAGSEFPSGISEDLLASMEKDGALQDAAIASSAYPLSSHLAMAPANICYRLTIWKDPGVEPLVADENCACKVYSVSARSFILASSEPEEYVAEMRTCYK